MTGDRLKSAERIFECAAAAAPDRRPALLAEHCGGDRELLAFVEDLLSLHESGMAGFLTRPALLSPNCELPAADESPSQIGRYRILRKLGEGGMGVVYEARQENPQRTVALKVIRPGLISSALRRRFQYEADVLGQLQHPGIAQVFEAGVTSIAGCGGSVLDQPFFAMEFIHGLPLNEYVESVVLDLRAKLNLVADISDAVQHGHQKGVIHRDLKPANILVDRNGHPKLIDFGVARCIATEIVPFTLHTEVGQLIGTVQYMSPEQVHADPNRIDTRSDVYALGVILYELLGGRPPYDLTNLALDQATRTIRETPPARLRTFNRGVRGDIETIVLKALAKDPTRRYQSAGEMRADILNYLAGNPIAARPPSLIYQLRLLARRNRVAVFGAAGVLLSLMAGLVVSTALYFRSESARVSEVRQRRIAQAVNDFLNQDLLSAISPRNTPDRDLKMRDVLDAAAARLEGRFADAPLVEARIRSTLGATYQSLGERESAEPHLARALEIHRRELGDEHPDTIASLIELGCLAYFLGRPQQSDEMLTRGTELARRILGPEHRRTLTAQNSLGFLRITQGRHAEADDLLTRTLASLRKQFGDDDPDTLVTLGNLGILRMEQHRPAEAERLLLEAIERERRVLSETHPDLLLCINNLASLYNDEKQFDKSEPLLTGLLETQRRVLGDDHPDTLNTMNNIGYLYNQSGRVQQSEPYYVQTLERRRRVLGNDHHHTLISMSNLAQAWHDMGRLPEAEKLLVEVLETRRRLSGPENSETHGAITMLASHYFRAKRMDLAEPLLAEVIALLKRAGIPDENEIGRLLFYRGICLRDLNRSDEAEQVWLECHQLLPAARDPSRAAQLAENLAAHYEAQGKVEQAAAWRTSAAASQPIVP